MTEILQWIEAEPDPFDYGMPDRVNDPGFDANWHRIEFWTGQRWAERTVTAIVLGPGAFVPKIGPVSWSEIEIYRDQWEATELALAPVGIELGCSTYRLTGTAGDDSLPPEAAQEAYRRLSAYLTEAGEKLGVTSYSVDIGPITESWRRNQYALANALALSGAADLLRPYRRLK